MASAKMNLAEFTAKRNAWYADYSKDKSWVSAPSEEVTKLAHKMYLEGRVPHWAA